MNTFAEAVQQPIEDMLADLDVASVFGDPIHHETEVIIPVADVMYGFGYGFGGDEAAKGESGGGGGGGGKATPRGFIRLTPDGVRYEPTNNDTLIAIAGMFTGIWAIFWSAFTLITLIKTVAKARSNR